MKDVCILAGILTTGFRMQNGQMLQQKSFLQRQLRWVEIFCAISVSAVLRLATWGRYLYCIVFTSRCSET
jgi:hypothetical protein